MRKLQTFLNPFSLLHTSILKHTITTSRNWVLSTKDKGICIKPFVFLVGFLKYLSQKKRKKIYFNINFFSNLPVLGLNPTFFRKGINFVLQSSYLRNIQVELIQIVNRHRNKDNQTCSKVHLWDCWLLEGTWFYVLDCNQLALKINFFIACYWLGIELTKSGMTSKHIMSS